MAEHEVPKMPTLEAGRLSQGMGPSPLQPQRRQAQHLWELAVLAALAAR